MAHEQRDLFDVELRHAKAERDLALTEKAEAVAKLVACEARLQAKPGASVKRTWVFHGTTEGAVPQIMEKGFKVGGQDVAVANATYYGQGVYTATGPGSKSTTSPLYYSRFSRRVILAQGIKGVFQDVKIGDESADSWRGGRDDWCIFRSKEQLLPVYVVHFDWNPGDG